MRHQMVATIVLCIILLAVSGTSSCSKFQKTTRDPKTPIRCLSQDIQVGLNDNQDLARDNIVIKVEKVCRGKIFLTVEKGFSNKTRYAIYRHIPLQEIKIFIDPSVNILLELEQTLRQRHRVIDIFWTAKGQMNGVDFNSTGDPVENRTYNADDDPCNKGGFEDAEANC